MPTLRGRIPDSLSTAASAGTGLGSINPRRPSEVRSAQLVTASLLADDPREAARDPAKRAEVREMLEALGIFNREGRVDEARPRRLNGLRRSSQPSQRGLPRDHKFAGEREPNGRLSRRLGTRRET